MDDVDVSGLTIALACTRGADRLQAMRLSAPSKTRRMIACCCATLMYMAFDDKRPWVSAFRPRSQFDIPVIGVEPGIKPAVQTSVSKVVGVLATAATLRSHPLCTRPRLSQSFAYPGLSETAQ